MAVHNTESFKTSAVLVHGDRYDYSLVEYVGTFSKVSIYCKRHKTIFQQPPNSHLSGRGCPECAVEATKSKQRKTQAKFLQECVEKYSELFDYSAVEYINGRTKVTIGCRTCGLLFTKSPEKHLAGEGCPHCSLKRRSAGRSSTTEVWVAQASEKLGVLFDYKDVVYKNNHTKVLIGCRSCGKGFLVQPNNHLQGRGCPDCAKTGYKTNKAGCLYLMTCGDVTKIGITNLNTSVRAKDISRDYGAEFTVVKEWKFDDGKIPDTIETTALRELRSEYTRPSTKFDGSSECFLSVDYEKLIARITSEIEALTA